jgi:hypothetical protein
MVDSELESATWDHSIVSKIIEMLLTSVTVWLSKDESIETIRSIKNHIWVGFVVEGAIGFVPVPMLIKVIKNFVLNSGNELSIVFSWGENPVKSGIFVKLGVEIEASVWLHSGGVWLLKVSIGEGGFSVWNMSALNNFNFKINIRLKWDWFSTEWWLGIGITPGVVRWAIKSGLVSLMQLWESKIPAFEYLGSTNWEFLRITHTLRFRIRDESSVLKVSFPVNLGPVSWGALRTSSGLCDADSNSRHIIVGAGVGVASTVWSIYIWSGVDVETTREAHKSCKNW